MAKKQMTDVTIMSLSAWESKHDVPTGWLHHAPCRRGETGTLNTADGGGKQFISSLKC